MDALQAALPPGFVPIPMATVTTVVPSRNEIVFPPVEVTGAVAEWNAVFGADAARLAKVEAEIEQEDGVMTLQFKVEEKGIGLKMDFSLEGSMDINTRAKSDPVGLPFRAASQSEPLTIPATTARAKLLSTGSRLVFPSRSVPILGLGANVTLSRGVEFVIKFE